MSNLMGKRLAMATFNYRPYSIVDLNANPPVLDGTEMRIAFEFCKKLNATFDVIVDAENEWGEIYENYTGNGILGNVVEDKAEFGYGAIYLWDYEHHYVDYSHPYIRTGITCVTPRPRLLAGWLTPVLPFTATCWAAVATSVVASAFSLFVITKATYIFPSTGTNVQAGTERYTSLWDCAFNALGLLVLQTPPDERTSTRITGPTRHVLVWLTVMFLLITTSYGSGLASILTIPRFGPPIDTVPDLAASNIPWAATHPAWIFSLRESRDPLTVHILSQFRIMKNEELKKHLSVGDTAFSIERLPAGHYAIGDYITEEAAATKLRLMKQDLYFEFVPTVVRKGSPYLVRLNKLIHRLLDSGLMLKWEQQPQLIQKYGYPVEEHTVKTEDGYLLTHFRIPHGRAGAPARRGRPVILQHGIVSASDIWVLMGQEQSLGFILADAGYDVWLTNIRGNRHSRKHVTLSPDSARFWNFSWHEIGYYDIPATVDYIMAVTGEKLYYIGHSMGNTVLFVMTSTRPEYNAKLRIAFALAPVAFLWNPSHQLAKALIPSSKLIAKTLEEADMWELLPYSKEFADLVSFLCCDGSPTQSLCVAAYYIAYGDDSERLNKTQLPVYLAHLIAGVSTKTVDHYAQIIRSGKFQAFDYGPMKNVKYYGQSNPPEYNLKNVTVPISLHYGTGDLLVSPEGVQHLSDQLPHLVAMAQVQPPKFNHIDFILATDAKPFLFDHILNHMTVY